MATAEYKATLNASGSVAASSSNLVGSVVTLQAAAASDGTDGTAFTDALATLVADGASPTQAHVTAVNDAWTTYKADIDAVTAAVAALTADVSVYIGSLANVSDRNKLKKALDRILETVAGSDIMASGSANP